MKRTLAFLVILVSTAAFLGALPLQASSGRALAFTHVNVIDATGAPLRVDMTVIIRGGRIVEVGKTGRIRVPKAAEIIDANGKFLIPGLWDMHAHLGTDDFDKQGHLALFIVNGVTGIRIMDGDHFSFLICHRHKTRRRERRRGAKKSFNAFSCCLV